jgi:hypothetical protein
MNNPHICHMTWSALQRAKGKDDRNKSGAWNWKTQGTKTGNAWPRRRASLHWLLQPSHHVVHPASLARLLLAPARHAPHLRRLLLASLSHRLRTPPAPRSSLLPYATPPALSRSMRRPPSRAKAGGGGGARMPPDPTQMAGIDWPRPFPLLCLKCMFQVFQRYIAMVTYGCCKSRSECCTCCKFYKCFQMYVASVLKKCFICFRRMLQQVFYLDVANVSRTYCKCFIWMLHMFHTYVASVLSGCYICFTHML